MDNYLERLENLVGKETIRKLKKKRVMICGVGGVGSFVAESLARSGVGELTIVDFDTIDYSNLNRQLMTNKRNIGKPKVDELKKRLEDISDCKVIAVNRFIDDKFSFRKKYDYVVDCIDSLSSKFALVKLCHSKNIRIISALGSAKRTNPENIRLTTLDKTSYDPLAKAFRSLVRRERYSRKIEVVFVESEPVKTSDNTTLGSSIFVPGSVGLYIGSVVFNRLVEEIDNEV